MSESPRNPAHFVNRELSWLAFDERVLEEAEDATNPLLERVKFAAIVTSNLDEFFMVRVASLHHTLAEGDLTPDLAGLTPVEQLKAISERTHELVDRVYALVARELMPALSAAGITIVAWSAIDTTRQTSLTSFFREHVLPVLTPLAVDSSRPFPLLSSLSLNLVLRLAAPVPDEHRLAVVQTPAGLQRLVRVGDGDTFILLEDLISAHIQELFPGQRIAECATLRLARDAELELDDEGGRTQLEIVERELKRRRRTSRSTASSCVRPPSSSSSSSASRASRITVDSRTTCPGKSCASCARTTSSSSTQVWRSGPATCTRRGRPDGTCTIASRRSSLPASGSSSSARLRLSGESSGNGREKSIASGVSTGRTASRK